MTEISRITFYGDSALSVSLGSWIDHFDKRELLYEMKFDTDALFGLKVCITIDRSFQLFLQSCQDGISIDNVDIKYLDFAFDQECIERGRFSCNPRAPLLRLFQAAIPRCFQDDPNRNKLRRRNALSGSISVPEDKDSLITNPDKNPDWILSDKEGYARAFPRAI